jgi:hypothetical protein
MRVIATNLMAGKMKRSTDDEMSRMNDVSGNTRIKLNTEQQGKQTWEKSGLKN